MKEDFFDEIFTDDQEINGPGYQKSGHSCHVQVSPDIQTTRFNEDSKRGQKYQKIFWD